MQEYLKPETGFTEKQSFRSGLAWLMYLPLGATVCLLLVACYRQLIMNKPFGDHPAPDSVLIFMTAFTAVLLFLLTRLRLCTLADKDGVGYRWSPFMRKYKWHRWQDIDKAELMNYGFVGYGIRISKHGWVHNVAGKKGLKITLKNKRSFVIGTQRPDELETYLVQHGLISASTSV